MPRSSSSRAIAMPCALAIGGLDPGGGAGIAADLRAFTAAGAFGCAAIAVVTVQSTSGLVSARALASSEVIAQAEDVVRHQRVRAIKTGALGSAANVRAVGEWLAQHAKVPAIVDPVMVPTRGKARLLAQGALRAMRTALLPRATLVTANVPEAEALTGMRVVDRASAHAAARAICDLGARAALVKGGHMTGPDAIDVLATRARGAPILELRSRRLRLAPTHGGGCTLASLIAGRIACDESLIDALRWSKRAHHAALASARDVGGAMRVLVP